MANKKILFIASLTKNRKKSNGETNKSLSLLECLKRSYRVKSVNVISRFSRLLKICIVALELLNWHPDIVFISKSVVGCRKFLMILKFFCVPPSKIIIYVNGQPHTKNGIIIDGSYKILSYSRMIFCENKKFFPLFRGLGCQNVVEFPCIKDVINIPLGPKANKDSLDLIFWARIVENKGVFKAIEAVLRLNKKAGQKLFSLTIAGPETDKETSRRCKEIAAQYPREIIFYGDSFVADSKASYLRLSKYDLNVFPSTFGAECVPGSVVDCMIAGVPTATSRFDGSEDMMSTRDSYFFDSTKPDDIDALLMYIHSHQNDLWGKRTESQRAAKRYSFSSFSSMFVEMI